MELVLINKTILILINAAGVWLGSWVYLSGRKSKANRYFFLMAISWIVEINAYYAFKWVVPFEYSNFVYKIGVAAVFTFCIFFYSFYESFLGEEKKFPILKILVPIIGVSGIILALFTNLLTRGVEIAEYGRNPLLTVVGKIIFLGYIVFLVSFIFFRFLKNYFKSSPEKKLRIQYFLIGLSLFIIVNFYVNVFLWIVKDSLKYSYIGNWSVLFILFFTSLAIVKQKLFGIKVILTQLLVGVMGVVLLIAPFLAQVLWFRVFLFGIFLLFCIIGYLLIRYSLREAKQKEILEKAVKERTKKLETAKDIAEARTREVEKRKADLEHFYKLTVGRELRMIELKKKIKELEEKLEKTKK